MEYSLDIKSMNRDNNSFAVPKGNSGFNKCIRRINTLAKLDSSW